MITLKRVYESGNCTGTPCFLVERLWPRGIKKESLQITAWLKDVAPSPGLRRWFNHDPGKWQEFRHRYFAELEKNPQSWKPILEAARKGDVVLLFSSHDAQHNNAAALKAFLDSKMAMPQAA
jgi:uncharacterized protein YeaO (DUF488 family)